MFKGRGALAPATMTDVQADFYAGGFQVARGRRRPNRRGKRGSSATDSSHQTEERRRGDKTQPRQRHTDGRGRGRGGPRRGCDFSSYVLRPAQVDRIVEWIERAADEWFEHACAAPVLCSQDDALFAMYTHWWNGLVALRAAKNLDTDATRNALMFRSLEAARAQFANNDYVRWVAALAHPAVVVASCAHRAGEDDAAIRDRLKNWWSPLVEHQLAVLSGIQPEPKAHHGMTVITAHEVCTLQGALQSAAQELLQECCTSSEQHDAPSGGMHPQLEHPQPVRPTAIPPFIGSDWSETLDSDATDDEMQEDEPDH